MKFINLKTRAEETSVLDPTVLCIGNFDGVHIGHRQLVDSVLKKQQSLRTLYPSLLTGAWLFDSNFYKSAEEIYTLDEKLDVFANLGLDYAIIADFNDMKGLSPIDFVDIIIKRDCKCIHAVCGENFRFGAKAVGDAKMLSELMNGYATIVSLLSADTELNEHNHTIVSSTYIRSLLASGDIVSANKLLKNNYSINELVVHGKALGRMLGIPTINQYPISKKLILKNGIYATVCTVDGRKYYGVTNVGTRPTVDDGDNKNVETHIIDFSDDCYDKYVKVEFVKRIRDEQKFETIAALKAQIENDILTTKQFFIS